MCCAKEIGASAFVCIQCPSLGTQVVIVWIQDEAGPYKRVQTVRAINKSLLLSFLKISTRISSGNLKSRGFAISNVRVHVCSNAKIVNREGQMK